MILPASHQMLPLGRQGKTGQWIPPALLRKVDEAFAFLETVDKEDRPSAETLKRARRWISNCDLHHLFSLTAFGRSVAIRWMCEGRVVVLSIKPSKSDTVYRAETVDGALQSRLFDATPDQLRDTLQWLAARARRNPRTSRLQKQYIFPRVA